MSINNKNRVEIYCSSLSRTILKRFKTQSITNIYALLLLIYSLGLSSFSYQVTHSYFSDSATSSINTFTATAQFPTITSTPIPTIQPGDVVINEIYYDVCTPASICGNNPQNEWVELYNNSSNTLDLSGWIIQDNNNSDALPSNTIIAPHSFLVITPETDTFNIWPNVPEAQRIIIGSNIGNGLNDDGDRIILKNDSSTLIDSLSYGSDTSILSLTGVAQGHSLERNPDGVDTNTAADFIDREIPQPGL